MKKKIMLVIITIGMLLGCSLLHFSASAQQNTSSDTEFVNDPIAHALYDKMIEAMRKAETLSYESDYRWESKGNESGHCTYTVWMKKPNYFRVETVSDNGEKGGIVIGDGNNLWIYWPNGRPFYYGEDAKNYQKTRLISYMKEPTPIAKHSIGHMTGLLGVKMSMPIIDPSTFHGYTDSLQPYIDGVRSVGVEKAGNEECDVIEVSIMKHQRNWYLWLSKRDHLPRKLKQVICVSYDIITNEAWSDVTTNAEIPMEKFIWKPTEAWTEWHPPNDEKELLQLGEQAPDFDLQSVNGGRIKLSDYRGKVVWLTIWRVGCPPCRIEMPYLEKLYTKHKDRGFVVLGFNCADDNKFVKNFLREHLISFPNILDNSDTAANISFEDYKAGGVPANYIIDRKGKIVDSWFGYSQEDKRGIEALEKLGIK